MSPSRPVPGPPRPRKTVVAGAHPLRKRAWTAGRLLLLAGALSVTFGAFFLTALRVTNRAREVSVPDLRGKSLDEANAMIAATGLVLKVDQRRGDPKIAADHVLGQDPDAGTILRRQRAVRIAVSDGQRDPIIPDATGQAERSADLVMQQDNVTIADRAEVKTTAVLPGLVVAQDPPPGARGGKVTLLVNRAEAGISYVMPDLIGTPGVNVVSILRRRGFRVTVAAEVPYPGLPAGIVVRQTPQAGFQVGFGDPVAIEITR